MTKMVGRLRWLAILSLRGKSYCLHWTKLHMMNDDFPAMSVRTYRVEPEFIKFYLPRLLLRLRPKQSTLTDSDSGFDSDSAPLIVSI